MDEREVWFAPAANLQPAWDRLQKCEEPWHHQHVGFGVAQFPIKDGLTTPSFAATSL